MDYLFWNKKYISLSINLEGNSKNSKRFSKPINNLNTKYG
jgi:hypothetical protein